MRHYLNACLIAGALVCFGTLAQAQFGEPGGLYQPASVTALVEKVHTDLNAGYDHWHLSNADRGRLNNAEKRLRNFAHDWQNAKFDKGDLDDSVSAIQHVLDNNHLNGPERDALWSDVDQLRKMREAYDRHEIGRW
jgi:hypothetical protein